MFSAMYGIPIEYCCFERPGILYHWIYQCCKIPCKDHLLVSQLCDCPTVSKYGPLGRFHTMCSSGHYRSTIPRKHEGTKMFVMPTDDEHQLEQNLVMILIQKSVVNQTGWKVWTEYCFNT
jgi:hypothetical protein